MGKHLEQALAFCVCTPVPNWLLLINVDNSAGRGTSYAILYLECYPDFGLLPFKLDHTLKHKLLHREKKFGKFHL